MKAALSWALVALVTWGVLELLARAWDHEYQGAAYRRER